MRYRRLLIAVPQPLYNRLATQADGQGRDVAEELSIIIQDAIGAAEDEHHVRVARFRQVRGVDQRFRAGPLRQGAPKRTESRLGRATWALICAVVEKNPTATPDEIAKQVGLTKRSVHRYFADFGHQGVTP